ncbi:MAG: hypothetical protein ABI693_26415 [Bryobacteraceae bacterium]
MNYFVTRGTEQFGPYTLADLQRYVASGNIALHDQARSEAMQESVSVQEILGNIPAPPAPSPQQSYGQVPGYLSAPEFPGPNSGPMPPGLHWAIVLGLSVATFGTFAWIWMFVEAAFVRKIYPGSKALIWYAIGIGGLLFGGFAVGAIGDVPREVFSLLQLGCLVFLLVGHYDIRGSLEEYYNSEENMGLQLSGVMTFFFNTVYFQYHLNRVRRWKQSGEIS